jgi:pimeloyl-ACP methyl ester carboxylesterase
MGSRFLVLLIVLLTSIPADAQLFPRNRRDTGPKPKNIQGLVSDARGKPLAGARVYVRDTKTKVVRTLTTDQAGIYKLFALPPTVDYEVYAEFKGKATDKKVVSQFLNREDNVLNFQIDVAVIEGGIADSPGATPAATIRTFDLVDLRATLEMPVGIPAPIPAILLLHGYGEDRSVWREFSRQLVDRGWAVMAMDLRGHGESKTKNQRPLQAVPEWRTSLHEFPVDLDPALDWLKGQPRIDNKKIVVIGSDVGANLALIASGRFPEVRTVIAVNPNLNESFALAGSAQDFQPKSALIVTSNPAEGDRIKALVTAPSRVTVVAASGSTANTARWVADKQTADAIFQWLKETF